MAATAMVGVVGLEQSLFSESWHLVAHLRVRLRQHADIHRHIYRGQVWYVLQDHTSGRHHRFTPEANQLIGLMDGQRTIEQIWQIACYRLAEQMPTQHQVIALLSQLFSANVLHSSAMPDIDALRARQQASARKKLVQHFKSPLSIRITLLDPDYFLTRAAPWVKPLFSRLGLAIWLTVVTLALLLAGMHWDALFSNLSDRVLTLEHVVLAALVYPVVKVVHEFGHACAVKHWGGEVHEMGIMLLVFFPVPYVDASAASSFRSKYQRMLVGAAGIVTEMFIAALAMIFWAYAEPGVARAIAFNTLLIAGVSTLLFNGNPLIRFDAYYVLADFLEIPNLASRANQYVGYLVKRYLIGVKDLDSPALSVREGSWMALYAITSYVYRLMIMMVIALFVASKFFFIGVLLALWSMITTVLVPMLKVLLKPLQDVQIQARKRRLVGLLLSALTLLVCAVFFLPLPYATSAEGVLSVSEKAMLRADTEGFVSQLHASSGQAVAAGELIAQLDDPELSALKEVAKAQVSEAHATFKAERSNRVLAEINRELMHYRQREFERVGEREAALTVTSVKGGQLILPQGERLLGRYLQRGEMLGYVVDFERLPVTVLVAEEDLDQVRGRTDSIEVRLVSDRTTGYRAELVRQMPASTQILPSVVLSTDGGGRVAAQRQADDSLQAVGRYFVMEIAVAGAPKMRLDERVYVLFKHPAEPVYQRWWRAIRRVFLRQLDV